MRTIYAHSDGNGKDILIAVGTKEENRDSIVKWLNDAWKSMAEAKKLNHAKKATLPAKVSELVEFDKKVIRPTLTKEMKAVYMSTYGPRDSEDDLSWTISEPKKDKKSKGKETSHVRPAPPKIREDESDEDDTEKSRRRPPPAAFFPLFTSTSKRKLDDDAGRRQ